jgi:hypothetical protein
MSCFLSWRCHLIIFVPVPVPALVSVSVLASQFSVFIAPDVSLIVVVRVGLVFAVLENETEKKSRAHHEKTRRKME